MLNSLYGIHPDKLKGFIGEYFPSYRARQLLKWVYTKYVFDTAQMTDLPADFKDFIQNGFDLGIPVIEKKLESSDGSVKFRLALDDGARIEMVLMPLEKKQTLCLSSQVGCSRACDFCATGKMGLVRNLQTHEIVQQVLLAASQSPQRITNLVFMGMGEPLDNPDNVLEALNLIQAEDALSFSPRRATISTCGIVPGIYRLADSGIKAKLAVSLNSAVDRVRDELMPVNKLYPLSVLKEALLYFQKKIRFRITFEYILIPGLNMGARDINALQKFTGDISCKINFIPYNQIPELPYRSPGTDEIEAFIREAQSLTQAVTLRRSRGSDVSGACGQLAAEAGSRNNGGS